MHQINLKNTAAAPWKGITLRCIEDKNEIFGEDCEFKYNVNSGSSINGQINFYNLKKDLKSGKNVYYCFSKCLINKMNLLEI